VKRTEDWERGKKTSKKALRLVIAKGRGFQRRSLNNRRKNSRSTSNEGGAKKGALPIATHRRQAIEGGTGRREHLHQRQKAQNDSWSMDKRKLEHCSLEAVAGRQGKETVTLQTLH